MTPDLRVEGSATIFAIGDINDVPELKKGAVQLPFGHPHFLISMKQKDLFVGKYLK